MIIVVPLTVHSMPDAMLNGLHILSDLTSYLWWRPYYPIVYMKGLS